MLEPLDNIECRDALLTFVPFVAGASSAENAGRVAGQRPSAHTLHFLKSPPTSAPLPDQLANSSGSLKAVEADWPKASIVIGNPPFLGQRFQVRELGEAYVKSLRGVYSDKVSGNVDLVCYWFVKALKALKSQGPGAAGFVATNSIRGGDNRDVLEPIAKQFNIFNAWSDEPWVNEGAAVRVSLVSFGNASAPFQLNGESVGSINADLSASKVGELNIDLTKAVPLTESQKTAFSGFQMNGIFNVPREQAKTWIALPNPNGKSSSLVLYPYANASDMTKRSRDEWVIDFTDLTESEASMFEESFKHVQMRTHLCTPSIGRYQVARY